MAHLLRSRWVTRLSTTALALFAALLAQSGCGGGSSEERLQAAVLSEGCLINSDCAAPLVCAFKRCHDACERTRDCPKGQRCLASDRPFHVCQLPDETECVYHSDCPSPLICGTDAECRDQCGSGRDCLNGQVCTQGTCADDDELVDGKLPEAETDVNDELDGQPCVYTSECPLPMVCRVGLCRAQCQADRDCEGNGVCRDGVCQTVEQPPDAPEHCSSRETDGDESDVDCGGACLGCAAGAACDGDADCSSGVCLDDICQEPACSDDVRNGAETETDCGGPNCDPCEAPPECEDSGDCDDDEVCKFGECRISACGNGALDGDETGVDCGGPDCAPCDHGGRCIIDGDCQSLNCDRGTCAVPTCTDGVTNGNETDKDCGGPDCGLCANGVECEEDNDCASGVCDGGNCEVPTCDDGVQNGVETDKDCGGVDCDPCGSGKGCRSDNDCAARQCLADVCGESFTLTVVTTGAGQGTVTSTDNRIQCGNDCEASFIEGTSVTLTAQPTSDSTFAGFSGDCSGMTCVVAMDDDHEVTAAFQTKEPATGWAVNLSPDTSSLVPGGLAADGAGRSYAVGAFSGTANFGDGDITAGGWDGYVAKYDATGTLAWARSLGTTTYEETDGVTVDSEGNVFVSGYTQGGSSASYGGGTLTCNSSALGLAKLSGTDGAHLASACVGGNVQGLLINGYDGQSQQLALKANGNPVFAATFYGNYDFGSFTLNSGGYYHWALGEVSAADLSVQHAINLGTQTNSNRAAAIAAHASDGSVAAVGECTDFMDIDTVPGERTPGGGTDVCVVKLDSNFELAWARIFGGTGADRGLGVAVADNGDVIVAGSFESQMSYGGTGVAAAQAAGGADAFVVRLASDDGSPVWAKDFGGPGTDEFAGVTVDPNSNNIALIGRMSSGLDLGGGLLPYFAFEDVMYLVLQSDGDYVDSAAAGTSTDDSYQELGSAIATNPAGGFLLYGRVSGLEGTAFGLEDTMLERTFLLSIE